MTRSRLPSREEIGPDTPLRLGVAAALAFPDGSMTASGLRRESARGRLVIERIAGKDYTTLTIERMRDLCRVEVKDRDFGCARPNTTGKVTSPTTPFGISKTANTERARDAALMIVETLKKPSLTTSRASTSPKPKPVSVPPAAIPVGDVLALYARDVAPEHARPAETGQRITALLTFFGDKVLSDLNGQLCRAYVGHRGTDGSARRELEDLRAAINHHRREGLCSRNRRGGPSRLPRRPARRWLTRSARPRALFGRLAVSRGTEGLYRPTGDHGSTLPGSFWSLSTPAPGPARFAPRPFSRREGRGWIDLASGVFYRRPQGRRRRKNASRRFRCRRTPGAPSALETTRATLLPSSGMASR